jgi:outer membrane protein TolC
MVASLAGPNIAEMQRRGEPPAFRRDRTMPPHDLRQRSAAAASFLTLFLLCGKPGAAGPAGPAPPPASGAAAPGALEQEPGPPVVPPEARLTLAAALALAQAQNPQLRTAGYQVASAQEALRAAKRPLDPQIGFDSGYSGTTNQSELFNAQDATLTGIVETSGRHHLRVAAAQSGYRMSQFDRRTALLTLVQGVTNAYIALQVANRALEVQTELYRLVSRQMALTQQQFRLGAAKENDVLRLQIAQTQSEQAMIQSRAAVSVARANLNLQLGRPADTPVDVAEALRYTPIDLDALDFQREAVNNRPEIGSEAAALRTLQVAVAQARAQYFPDVTAVFRPYGLINRDWDFTTFAAAIQLPLPLGAIHHQTRKAEADVHAEEARREQLLNQVSLDVRTALLTLEQWRRVIDTYESGVLARARLLVERTQRGIELGGTTVLDVIDAQTAYRSALVNYYQAVGSHQQALAQLERALGGPVSAAGAPQAPPSAEPAEPGSQGKK